MNEIVTVQHREAITTSLKVAEVFNKNHQHVLDAIRKLDCPKEFGLSNFRQSSYVNEQNKKLPMYDITRDGFSLLAMGFTGKKALQFKIKYIDAFNRMEAALLQSRNLAWQEQRNDGKVARRIETDTIASFADYATAQGSQSAKKYYMQITRMTNQALFLVKQSSPQPFRDFLDSMQHSFLATAEYIVCDVLEDGMSAGLHYKDIYQLARERVERYAATLPKQKILEAA